MPDPLDKIRDEIAAKLGWHKVPTGWTYSVTRAIQSAHPVPASLDWVSENWPNNDPMTIWRNRVTTGQGVWNEWRASTDDKSSGGPTELHARFALYLAVLEAEGKTQ